MSSKIFEYERTNGDVLSEHFDRGSFFFEYRHGDNDRRLECYSVIPPATKNNTLYLGRTLDEILDSPTDILGDELLKNGTPDYYSFRGVLPQITEDAYCFLGGAASHASVTVDRLGNITPQLSGKDNDPAPLFEPTKYDTALCGRIPTQYFLDRHFPILFNVFDKDSDVTELLYFVDSGDSDRDPIVWIREKKYIKDRPDTFTLRYGVKEFSHGYANKVADIFEVGADIFNDTLAHTINHWLRFTDSGASLDLPIDELVKVTEGAMISAATTFTGPRPHYGHKYYGKELHDNFPPNYIWSIEAAILTGHEKWAREIYGHLMNYGLTDEGKFCYRQGPFISGASAVEYAMILWLTDRYKTKLFPYGIDEEYVEKLCGMGNIILSHLIPCPEFDGLELVKMCAEADNNVRVNVYLNNNLWSIRGLEALYRLCKIDKYKYSADIIKQNVNLMLKKHSLTNTEFGDVPPFRFNYSAIPYTLSNCKTHLLPTDEEAVGKYFYRPEGRRDFDVTDQEITENTYANYRYYPEVLSSMLLPSNLAEGIFRMREKLGGNLLGMTRFRSWIDNWPVLNYARYLIETGKVEKYLLLLYAHTQLHGHPNLMCYYEQIKLYGKVSAHDCVPSLLTTPIMTTWMFAYETVDGSTLRLLSTIPKEWFNESFSAKGLGISDGSADIIYDREHLTVRFSRDLNKTVEIVFNAFDSISMDNIKKGSEFIKSVNKNVVVLKRGITEAVFVIK